MKGKGEIPFFDTNVLVYLLSADRRKADRAESLVASGGTISVQVLNEMAHVMRRKTGMGWGAVRDVLAALRAVLSVVPMDQDMHNLGIDLAERHGFSVWDAMIVAAAQRSGASVLWSEDMDGGLTLPGGPAIRNPFA